MFRNSTTLDRPAHASALDRILSLFTEVRAGEGVTAALMLLNIFLLLVCYSVIKTVREPLILLGGGAEVRSYAAAGQALLLMGMVPLYGWFASRVDRAKLLIGVTLFFIAGIELFAAAVAAHLPFVGVAFFIWVGIFNMSLIAQFWSFANDIYTKDAGDRLFPIIMIGMTAGAPLGSFIAARLFRSGITPQMILHVAAILLAGSVAIYLKINAREHRSGAPQAPLAASGGFRLVLGSHYLRLIAALVVLLNVVNTTGEYLVARLLSLHVEQLAIADVTFDKQAYIGAFSGDYQFWVNVSALLLQAFVTSRLVKYRGLRGALLALPLIALGGYAIIAAGVGFSVVRWIKTAENATDYSIMNTARQLLWLPTSREEKYKAKQAIDTFFVRGGDVLSAGVVYIGAHLLHLGVNQFALVNVALIAVWIGVAVRLAEPKRFLPSFTFRPIAGAAAAVTVLCLATPAHAQETRQEAVAAQQANKAAQLKPFVPDSLERKLDRVDAALSSKRHVYPYFGSVYDGGGFGLGPGYRFRYADTGSFDAHAAVSIKSYKTADLTWKLPSFAANRIDVSAHANWLDAPDVVFYGTATDRTTKDRTGFSYGTKTVGATGQVHAATHLTFGGGLDSLRVDASPLSSVSFLTRVKADFARSRAFAEFDTRTSRRYTRRGSFYRVERSDYRQTNGSSFSFARTDVEAQQYLPFFNESRVIALRALVSTTSTTAGQQVPYPLMPYLGGSHTLRGYSTFRFRDNNRLLLSGEYRWAAGSLLDMSVFLDAGKVTERSSDLDLHGLTKTYGVGFSVHAPANTAIRLEIARTREGTGLSLGFGPSF
jgi:ATP:ADP antiporter, AAA family